MYKLVHTLQTTHPLCVETSATSAPSTTSTTTAHGLCFPATELVVLTSDSLSEIWQKFVSLYHWSQKEIKKRRQDMAILFTTTSKVEFVGETIRDTPNILSWYSIVKASTVSSTVPTISSAVS